MAFPWNDKVGNIFQVGGIETSVLDNGPAKGSRIAWINTGSGLRFKVAIDRSLDIVDAFYNQHQRNGSNQIVPHCTVYCVPLESLK